MGLATTADCVDGGTDEWNCSYRIALVFGFLVFFLVLLAFTMEFVVLLYPCFPPCLALCLPRFSDLDLIVVIVAVAVVITVVFDLFAT